MNLLRPEKYKTNHKTKGLEPHTIIKAKAARLWSLYDIIKLIIKDGATQQNW
jgi:hypothetical protein